MVRKLLFIVFLFCVQGMQAQVKISGYVYDANSKEVLIGAHVVNTQNNLGVPTDINGYFTLSASAQSVIKVSYIGFESQELLLAKDTVVHLYLHQGEAIDEVTVTAQKHRELFNVDRMNAKTLESVPTLGGKPDVMKAIQLLPGVQGMGEGMGMIMVRGGDPGQNLYLLDQTPLIYVNHLGGFMSVFNPDMINSIDIYKGGFPAKYGGKLSSIMDISQREGNKNKRRGSFSIGLTDASFSLEGPALNKKASYLVTGRKTLFGGLFFLGTYLSGSQDNILSYGFHDINAKFTYKPNANNSYFFNLYQGDDYLNSWEKDEPNKNAVGHLKNVWGNWLVSGKWNHLYNSGVLMSNALSFNQYRVKEEQSIEVKDGDDFLREYKSVVQDLGFRSDWTRSLSKNYQLNYGAQLDYRMFAPNYVEETGQSAFPYQETNSFESALYVDNKLRFGKHWQFNIGLRGLGYFTESNQYWAIEPRLSANYSINRNHLLNATYQQVNQSSHLLTTKGSINQNEIWIPADKDILPAKSDQYSVGWKGFFADSKYAAEVNAYYKEMSQLTTFKEGYSFMPGDIHYQNKLESGGVGESMGMEFQLKKQQGRVTGFAAYALSKTTRNYSGINSGNTFLFDYDRPHSFSLNLSYRLNEKIAFTAVWMYQTGLPYTPVTDRHYVPSTEGDFYYEAMEYGDRNSMRMKAYHRLDIGMTYEKRTKRDNRAIWSFSVYNLYNRQNPNYYYYNNNNTGEIHYPEMGNDFKSMEMYQMALFPFIPSVSYKVFFGENPNRVKPDKAAKKQKRKDWWYFE